MKKIDIKKMTTIGVLSALSIMLGLTPLGFIPIGPTRATIMHIPVIIGAIMEGPLVGGAVGLIFGLVSIFQNITNPTPISFVFLNPIVSIVPRVLIGINSYYAYKFLHKTSKKRRLLLLFLVWISTVIYLIYGLYINIKLGDDFFLLILNIAILIVTLVLAYYTVKNVDKKAFDIIGSTIVGTATNTIGVMFFIYIFYAKRFVETLGRNPDFARNAIIAIGLTNGVPEIIVAIIIVTSITGLIKARKE